MEWLIPISKRIFLRLPSLNDIKPQGICGIGFVQGFGLKKGAIGSSVAHDSHNVVIVGTNDQDMLKVVEVIQAMRGGLVVVLDGKVLASLPLPIAGLMSGAPVARVNHQLEALHGTAKNPRMQNSRPLYDALLLILAGDSRIKNH